MEKPETKVLEIVLYVVVCNKRITYRYKLKINWFYRLDQELIVMLEYTVSLRNESRVDFLDIVKEKKACIYFWRLHKQTTFFCSLSLYSEFLLRNRSTIIQLRHIVGSQFRARPKETCLTPLNLNSHSPTYSPPPQHPWNEQIMVDKQLNWTHFSRSLAPKWRQVIATVCLLRAGRIVNTFGFIGLSTTPSQAIYDPPD